MNRRCPYKPERWRTRATLLLVLAGLFCLLIYHTGSLDMLWMQGCGSLPMGVIVADSRGRLGNNLAEYATIYALGIRYNLTAVATASLLRTMGAVCPFTTLPLVSDHCVRDFRPVNVTEFVAMPDVQRRRERWKIDYYPHRIQLFWRYRQQLLKEFEFRADLVEYAQAHLRTVADGSSDVTYVGLHVRRTDFARHLQLGFNGHLVNESFYHSAMTLCRQRYRQPVFIVASDDLEWCREHLTARDVHILGDGRSASPGTERDLALLAACNHTIFDYGTYGFFAAFLAGGDMILADGYSEAEPEVVQELREGNITATYIDGAGKLLSKCVHCP